MEKLKYMPPTPTAKPLPTLHESCSRSAATQSANFLIGCYRKSDVGDPEIFTRALVALLMAYPEAVVVDVVKNLPASSKWLPSLAEVKEACELRSRTTGFAAHWNRVVSETLDRRR
jgi:hypothetical protein